MDMIWDRKIAVLDLGTKDIHITRIPTILTQRYLGGKGIDEYLFYNLLETNINPFEPTIPIFLSIGMLTGTPIPAGDRVFVSGKSPATGFIDTSILAGPMAVELKFAGLDHLVIRGKAPYPVFLWIHNGKIEIQDASWIWGLGPERTKMEIQDFLGDEDVQVMSIGWAGEKMFQFEQFESGETEGVLSKVDYLLGVKGLKAIVVRGTQPIEISDPDKAIEHLVRLENNINLCNYEQSLSIMSEVCHSQEFSDWGIDNYSAIVSLECFNAVLDALGAGYPGSYWKLKESVWTEYSLLIEAITGDKYTPEQLKTIGERIVNIHRLLSIREGYFQTEDNILRSCLSDSKSPEVFQLKSYYCCHGWDIEGKPTPATLKRLQLEYEPTWLSYFNHSEC